MRQALGVRYEQCAPLVIAVGLILSRNPLADSVREISFAFYNDALYQVIVNCGRDRGGKP